jgi:hypothetical protein
MNMELEQMADLLVAAAKKASEQTGKPLSELGTDKARVIADMQSEPEIFALFNEFGKLYTNAELAQLNQSGELAGKAEALDTLLARGVSFT